MKEYLKSKNLIQNFLMFSKCKSFSLVGELRSKSSNNKFHSPDLISQIEHICNFYFFTDHLQPGVNSHGVNVNHQGNMVGGVMNSHQGGYGGPQHHHLGSQNNEDIRVHGTELVMLYDYKV